MNSWNYREAHDLVDALVDSGRIDAATAARAHDLVDRGCPSRALALVRQVGQYVLAQSA